MEYISNALVLPVPLNLVRIPRAVMEYCCEGCNKEEEEEEEDENDAILNGMSYDAPPIIKNGVEVRSVFLYEPHHEETCLRIFRLGPTQTKFYRHTR